MLLVRLRGTKFDLFKKKIGKPWKLITFYFFQFFFQFSKNDYFVAIKDISTKKLVKSLFVNIDVFENSKTETPTLYQFLHN